MIEPFYILQIRLRSVFAPFFSKSRNRQDPIVIEWCCNVSEWVSNNMLYHTGTVTSHLAGGICEITITDHLFVGFTGYPEGNTHSPHNLTLSFQFSWYTLYQTNQNKLPCTTGFASEMRSAEHATRGQKPRSISYGNGAVAFTMDFCDGRRREMNRHIPEGEVG